MISEWKDFNEYRFMYFTQQDKASSAITLYNEKDEIGSIRFTFDPPVSKNYIDNDGKFILWYHIGRFNDIINILRYEKPLNIYIDSDSKAGGIGTSREPIGEQELK